MRCLLLFCRDGIVRVETDNVRVNPPWRMGWDSTFGDDILSHLFWGPILSLIHGRLYRKPYEREVARILEEFRRLGEYPRVRDVLEALGRIKGEIKIKELRIAGYTSYEDVEEIEFRGGRLRIRLHEGKEAYDYHGQPKEELKRLVRSLTYILGPRRVKMK